MQKKKKKSVESYNNFDTFSSLIHSHLQLGISTKIRAG